MKYKTNNIVVSGSLVYDRIMDFPGYFKDHIMPDKIHILNVAFAVNSLKESYGGCAGNIAYNLALLGERPIIASCAGKDFGQYGKWLKKNKVDISQINILKNKNTASCYIITDKSDNQITGFNPEALSCERGEIPLDPFIKGGIAIIAPGNGKDMENYAKIYKKKGIRYIFDPGQQITSLSGAMIKRSLSGAEVLIGNDYEISLITKKTGWTINAIIDKVGMLIITKGEKGSLIHQGKKKYNIPAVKIKKTIDPTGAGDAYRAGLIKGLVNGWPIEKTCRLASVVASYAVEKRGTQEHKFNWSYIRERYYKNYRDTM